MTTTPTLASTQRAVRSFLQGNAWRDHQWLDTGNNILKSTINALAGDDTVNAGDRDTVYGGADSDHLYGGAGGDTLYGQAGNDFLYGEGNNDQLYGGSGDDFLDGGDNTDTQLHGGSGNDTIFGGVNGDTIIGGYGADLLTGGADNDVFVYQSTLDTNDTITDFRGVGAGNDQLNLSAIDANSTAGGNQDFVWLAMLPSLTAYGSATTQVPTPPRFMVTPTAIWRLPSSC